MKSSVRAYLGPSYTDTFSNRSIFFSLRFQIDPLWIAYSNVCVFIIDNSRSTIQTFVLNFKFFYLSSDVKEPKNHFWLDENDSFWTQALTHSSSSPKFEREVDRRCQAMVSKLETLDTITFT